MKRVNYVAAMLALLGLVCGFAGASAEAAGTLDALAVWNAPHMIVHAEYIPKTLSRLGNSFLFETMLDEAARTYVKDSSYSERYLAQAFARFARRDFSEWMQNSPIESISLTMGLKWPNAGKLIGAIRFSPDKQEFLTQLSMITDEDGAKEKLKNTLLSLIGVPDVPVWRDGRANPFSLGLSIEGANLYKIGLYYASVEKCGDENILLFGSEPKAVETARMALKDGTGRTEITRRGAAERKVFVQIRDTKNGSLSEDLPRGVFPAFKVPVFLELSLGLEEEKIDVSLHHNFIDVFLGNAEVPESAWLPDNPGLKFGGGRPWLAGLFSTNLTEDDIFGLLAVTGLGRHEAQRFFEAYNISANTLTKAFRSSGFVIGGKSSYFGREIPGGYMFLSGGAEEMRTLSPFVRKFIENSFYNSEEAAREGWDFFYTFHINDDDFIRAARLPMFAGMKEGTLLLGKLAPETLNEEPEIMWSVVNEKDVFRVSLNVERLRSVLPELRSSLMLGNVLNFAMYSLGLRDVFNMQTFSALLYTLICAQEVKEVSFAGAWDSFSLTFTTEEVDYKQVWELVRIVRDPDMEDR